MDNKFFLQTIGRVNAAEGRFRLELDPPFIQGLLGLEGFSYLNVLWWADQVDNSEARAILTTDKPYKKAPEKLGLFATRSPVRPNPICVSAVPLLYIDIENGKIDIAYIDAEDGTPVIDIKPYHPATDRVKKVSVPDWCSHWPEWLEDSAEFDWAGEFVNAQ